MDATRPAVVIRGKELRATQPTLTAEELQSQFAPNPTTLRRMRRAQRLRAQLKKTRDPHAKDQDEDDEEPFFPIYADRPGCFQADICFMPEDQVFNGYQGIVCLISINRKVAWCVPYKANRDAHTGTRRRQIPATKMYVLLARCIDEIQRRFKLPVKHIESDDESMFKGECSTALQQRGISQYFVQPSVSGPFKTKLGIVERFNRTIKLYLNKLMEGYDTKDWASLLPEALYYYNFQHKQRGLGMRPAQVDDEQEKKIASQKYQDTLDAQKYYDNKYFHTAHPQAFVPRAVEDNKKEESRDVFKKERPNWSRSKFVVTRSVAGPSLNVTHPHDPAPKKRKFLPYNLKWR